MGELLYRVHAHANVKGEVVVTVHGPCMRQTLFLSPDEAELLMASLPDAIEHAKAFRGPRGMESHG